MAAEQILCAGYRVDIYDAMPSLGRKFLLAGIGGMNITHAEAFEDFVRRYAENADRLRPLLKSFGADQLRAWIHDLGIETFIGTSGRVFPKEMKAAPLLRAWLARLKKQGLNLHARHRWQGWTEDGRLRFSTPDGELNLKYDALVLALGGGSWAKLGSDGAWTKCLQERHVSVAELKPANCGFLVHWSAHMAQHFAGAPLKSVSLSFADINGVNEQRKGELIVTKGGVEGSLIYAFSAHLRDHIEQKGEATFYLDLMPDRSTHEVLSQLQRYQSKKSLGSFLQSQLKLDAAKKALVFEAYGAKTPFNASAIANLIKAIPITVYATTPIDEAISTAGGVRFEAMNADYMLNAMPGVFCAGEMLDWEAPTGGYLLTACFSTGKHAGEGVVKYLAAIP